MLVSKEEIEHIATLMRIEIDDTEQYLAQTQRILNYFDMLDKADVASEEIPVHEMTLDELRRDEYVPYESKLIDQLKNYKGKYIRAPKMN